LGQEISFTRDDLKDQDAESHYLLLAPTYSEEDSLAELVEVQHDNIEELGEIHMALTLYIPSMDGQESASDDSVLKVSQLAERFENFLASMPVLAGGIQRVRIKRTSE
jgi:hypothetical protein